MKQTSSIFKHFLTFSPIKVGLVLVAVIFGLSGMSLTAFAATPSLSVSQNGTNVNITVSNADANASVNLFQKQSSQYWSQISNLGQTSSSGSFTVTQPLAWDGSSNPIQFYVLIDNLQSTTAQLYPGSSGSGSLSLSQTTLSLASGQSASVTAYPTSGSVYVSSNSNSSIISYTLSGNLVNIYGIQSGASVLTLCSNSSQCGTVAVTVNGSGTSGNFIVSPSSLSIPIGQSGTATVLNATGTVYISSNTNAAIASTGLNGQTITVNGLAAGTTTITVCQSGNSCVSLYVTVGGSTVNTGSGLTFSSPSVQVSLGQNANITSISSPAGNPVGNNNNFYISSNSSPTVAVPSVSGLLLSVNALTSGSTTVTVCQAGYSYCGSVYVTVSGLNGSINFSQTNLSLTQGQNSTISVSGGSGSFYLSSNSNPAVASASFSSNVLYVTGLGNGSTTLTVCQSSSSNSCGTAIVTVGANTGTLTFSSSNTLTVGQSEAIAIYSSNNFTGTYVVSGNSNSVATSATVSGGSVNVTASAAGSSYVTVCESGSAICGSFTVTVNNPAGSAGPLSFAAVTLPPVTAGQYFSYQLQGLGGTGSYSYSLSSGSLPQGLNITSGGLISGTAGTSSGSSFTVLLVDSSGSGTASTLTIPSGNGSAVLSSPNPAPTTGSAYQNGQLINENGTVYIVYKNTKTGFANALAFTGLGFKFSNITNTSNSGLAASGSVVTTASAAHPWGSWILSGSTVYFVSQGGLIPVTDWTTFLNNGGQANFIVKANSYDLALSQLTVMTSNDSRLH